MITKDNQFSGCFKTKAFQFHLLVMMEAMKLVLLMQIVILSDYRNHYTYQESKVEVSEHSQAYMGYWLIVCDVLVTLLALQYSMTMLLLPI